MADSRGQVTLFPLSPPTSILACAGGAGKVTEVSGGVCYAVLLEGDSEMDVITVWLGIVGLLLSDSCHLLRPDQCSENTT